tara:strand:+ start:5630 stop:6472 length:843 start_codon:yes stop_codon:yes gene_type:complete
MDNLVGAFADETFPVELADRIKTLDRLLQSLNYSDHIVGVQNIISISENQTIEDTRGSVEAVLIDAAKSMITEYGLRIEKDDIVVVTGALKVLNNLVEYDDLQMILDNCDQGSPEDTLAFIVEAIEGIDATQTLDALDYVLPALIVRIETTVEKRIQLLEQSGVSDEELDKQVIRERLKGFFSKYPNSNLKQLFEDGFRVGYKIDIYLNAISEKHIDNLDEKKLAIDFVGCCYASGMVDSDIETIASDKLDVYTSDTHGLQRLVAQVRKVIYGGQKDETG